MDLIQAYLDLDSETIMNIAAQVDGRVLGEKLMGTPVKKHKTRNGANPALFRQSLGFMDKVVSEFKAITYDMKIVDSQMVRLSKPTKTEGYRRLVFNGTTVANFRANRNGDLRVFWETISGKDTNVYIRHEADINEVTTEIVNDALSRNLMKVEQNG
jgi:hypothetical protein